MASYPPRREAMVAAVHRLLPQVDRLELVLNQYDAPPAELAGLPGLSITLAETNLKDVGKFLPRSEDADLIFFVDDDVIYPEDYIARTVALLAREPAPAAWGYHGTTYVGRTFPWKAPLSRRRWKRWMAYQPGLIASYSRKSVFYEAQEGRLVVDQIATNSAVIRREDYPGIDFMAGSEGFVDVRLTRWLHGRGLASVCLPRAAGWLGAVRFEETIFDSVTRQNPPHIAEEIWSFLPQGALSAPRG